MTRKRNPHAGHRQRLREKFLKSGLAGFHDYEVIELLLTIGTPLKDCKQPAKELIRKFKTVSAILDADPLELQQIKGVGPKNIFGLKIVKAVAEIYHAEKIEHKQQLNSPEEVFAFLKNKIGAEKQEHFMVLFFDTKNNLIVEEVTKGTLQASLAHPREIFKKAIQLSASHILIAHNHPSGDPTPSQADIQTTKRLIEAGKVVGISVVDHLVVSANKFVSIATLYPNLF